MKLIKQLTHLSLLILTPVLFAQQITVPNPSFEDNNSGPPQGWTGDLWDKADAETYLRVESGNAFEGNNYLVLESRKENHLMAMTTVAVEPGYYLFTAMAKTENVDGGSIGAHLGIDGVWGSSESMNGTITDWTELKVSIKVNPGLDSLKLSLQLGGFSALNTGKASFDQVRLVKTSAHSEGVPAMEVGSPEPPAQQNTKDSSVTPAEKDTTLPPPKSGLWMIILLLAVAGGVTASLILRKRKSRAPADKQE